MTDRELTALIIWLVESQPLEENQARALLFRILERVLSRREKKRAPEDECVYNQSENHEKREST